MKKTKMSKDDEKLLKPLLELHDSVYWKAIKNYNLSRSRVVDAGLRSIDPIVRATEITRMQGVLMGIYDMEIFVEMEKKKIIEKNKKNVKVVK